MKKIPVRCVISSLLFVGSLAITHPVWAHAHLKMAVPADNSEVSVSPKQLKLQFSEALEAAFSGVQLKDAKGSVVPTASSSRDPADKRSLIVPLDKPLAAGKYQVDWHALSVDGHKTQGQYSFSVK